MGHARGDRIDFINLRNFLTFPISRSDYDRNLESVTYMVFHKKEPLYFRHNSRISWSIFIVLAPLDAGMNTP